MKTSLTIVVLSLLMLTAACGSGGGNGGGGNYDTLSVIRDTYNVAGDQIQVDLQGPSIPVVSNLTYYVFGSDVDLGDPGMIPLGHERLDETAFGPLAFTEELANIDLSPWAGYEYTYIRVVGALPNMAFRVDPGFHYIYRAD